MRHRSVVPMLVLAAAVASIAHAEEPALPETALGTVDVTGSGGGVYVQSVYVAVKPGRERADAAAYEIVRNDLRLSGQFDPGADPSAPPTLADKDGAVDLEALKAITADVVVRVSTEDTGSVSALTAHVFLPKSGKKEAAFKRTVLARADDARMSAHRLSDAVMGALTGRAGAFASRLAFVARAGSGQQVFVGDADGYGIRGYGPKDQVALSPEFGPGDSVYYALSTASGPFRFTEGESAQPVVWPIVKGNVLGVAFSHEKTTLALSVSTGRGSEIVVRAKDGTTQTLASPPNAHHPAFGPKDVLAWVAGNPPRVHVGGVPISPANINASSPTFCDSPQGLLIAYSLQAGRDSAIYVSDVKGGGLRRLTSSGYDEAPACSADGRLIAFVARRGKEPGIYVMPITAPGHLHKIASTLGSGLHWSRPLADVK
jgi:TolB protein